MSTQFTTCDPRLDPKIPMSFCKQHFGSWVAVAEAVGTGRSAMTRFRRELKLTYLPPMYAHRLLWLDPEVFMQFAPGKVVVTPPPKPFPDVQITGQSLRRSDHATPIKDTVGQNSVQRTESQGDEYKCNSELSVQSEQA